MLILFTGHRDRTANISDIQEIADKYKHAVWLHGGATGFDSQIESFAKSHNIITRVVKPNYDRYGKSAPLIRNREMVKMCTMVVALYDGRMNGGTYYTIKEAKKLRKHVQLFHPLSINPDNRQNSQINLF